MKKTLHATLFTLGILLVAANLTAESTTTEQLLDELKKLRGMVNLQQETIESLQEKVDKNGANQHQIRTELSDKIKQTFYTQTKAANVSATGNSVFYGQLHASVDFLDNGTYLSGNSSRVGLRGQESINEEFNLLWQIEASINIDEGSDHDFNLRDTYVGFKHESKGSLLLGRMDSAFERLHRWTDFFDDQIGDSRNIVGLGPKSHGFDNREDNSIKYISPEINGYTTMATFTTGEGNQNKSTFAVNTAYRNNAGLLVAGGIEVHDDGLVTGNEKEIGYRLVTSYAWENFKVSSILEYLDNLGGTNGQDRTAGGFGGAYTFDAKNTLKAQFRHSNGVGDDQESTGYSLGWDHHITEQTRLYLSYAITLNGSEANNGVTGGGHGEKVTPQAGDNSQGVSVGIVHGW